jgi:hypothetical protein
MIFAGLILLLIGAITFFHYTQGFFGAAISAILTVFAAIIAVSYHEMLVPLFGGAAADFASALSLMGLFLIIYILLRVAFDKAVPGNVRVPVIADKVGAAVMGLFAGIFATGIVVIGAQELPFAPSIAGFVRYDSQPDRQVTVDTKGKSFYSKNWDELSSTTPGTFGDEHGLPILPVDNIVIGLVDKLSTETGSLQNDKPLYRVHPDFLGELYGDRVGIEPGTLHTATNLPSAHMEAVRVSGLFTVDPKIAQVESEFNSRSGGALKPVDVKGNEMLLAVRVMFNKEAADADGIVRFSPGSARLMLHKDPQSNDPDDFEDFYPIGTMQGTDRLMLNKVDDFLFCQNGKGADLVYKVPKKSFEKSVPDGTFIEVKRQARVDLGGMKVSPKLVPSSEVEVMRKTFILHPDQRPGFQQQQQQPAPKPQQSATPSQQPASGGTASPGNAPNAAAPANAFKVDNVAASSALPTPLAIAAPKSGDTQQVSGGYVKFDGQKLKNAVMDSPTADLKDSNQVSQFSVPAGQAMVQVSGTPAPGSAWTFATEPENFELVDSKGSHYAPNGILALYKAADGLHIHLRYIDSTGISGAAAPSGNPEVPTQVVLLYVVPANTTITEFDDHGQKDKQVSVVAK